ncbi:MAG: hypothetical protein RBR97_20765 [Bacteroidales bacterium]|nr:hypothetical protein [Bacteroidales bacterium]
MCESEFLLVKQAAAERLGVSPDRLRIKFVQFDVEDLHLDFSCLFVTSIIMGNSSAKITVDNLYNFFLQNSLFGNGFFAVSIYSADPFLLSGYSFEVV